MSGQINKHDMSMSKVKLTEDDTDMKEFLEMEKMSGNGDVSEINKKNNLLSKRVHNDFSMNASKMMNDSLFDPDLTMQLDKGSPKKKTVSRMKSVGRVLDNSQILNESVRLSKKDSKNEDLNESKPKITFSSSRNINVPTAASKLTKADLNSSHVVERSDSNARNKLGSPKIPVRDMKTNASASKPGLPPKSRPSLKTPHPEPVTQPTLRTSASNSKLNVNLQKKPSIKGTSPGVSREPSPVVKKFPNKLISSKSMEFDFSDNKTKSPPKQLAKSNLKDEEKTVAGLKQSSSSTKLPSQTSGPKLSVHLPATSHAGAHKLGSPDKKPFGNSHEHGGVAVEAPGAPKPPVRHVPGVEQKEDHSSAVKTKPGISHLLTSPSKVQTAIANTKSSEAKTAASAAKTTEEKPKSQIMINDEDMKILKKASFSLLPDSENKDLVKETFEDVLSGKPSQKVGSFKKDSQNESKDKSSSVAPEDALSQLTTIVKDHFELRKEKVILEMQYLEQYVKKYKSVMLSNLDICMKQALSRLKSMNWESIASFKLDTLTFDTDRFDTVKKEIKKIYVTELVDFKKFTRPHKERVVDLGATTTDIVDILDQFRQSEAFAAMEHKKKTAGASSQESRDVRQSNETMELTALGSDVGVTQVLSPEDQLGDVSRADILRGMGLSPVHHLHK